MRNDTAALLCCSNRKPIQHPRAGTIKLVGPAVSYNGKRMPLTRPPPWLSQHTDEVRDCLPASVRLTVFPTRFSVNWATMKRILQSSSGSELFEQYIRQSSKGTRVPYPSSSAREKTRQAMATSCAAMPTLLKIVISPASWIVLRRSWLSMSIPTSINLFSC